jgi:hypothetical protein
LTSDIDFGTAQEVSLTPTLSKMVTGGRYE